MLPGEALDPSRRLGPPPESDLALIDRLPPQAREIVDTSIDLFRRTARLDDVMAREGVVAPSPVLTMLERLAYSI
jgi:regulator of CtrA degradation